MPKAKEQNPDLQFCWHPSFVTCVPLTERGLDWIADNIGDDALEHSGLIVIEHRYLEDIVLGARADGLVCHGWH